MKRVLRFEFLETLELATEASASRDGLDQGEGTREGRPQRWTRVRLVHLGAQGERTSKGRIQARGRAAPDREGNGSVGNYLLQAVQESATVVEKAIETAGLMLGTDKS